MTRTIIGPMSEGERRLLTVLNQIFEIEKKLSLHGDPNNLGRNINRTKDAIEELGFFYEDPIGQDFQETRTDIEATISGKGTEQLKIVEVIKPIVRYGQRALSRVVQKGHCRCRSGYRDRGVIVMVKMINYGIDLGTTNSLIARFNRGAVEVFKNPNGFKETLPSIVGFRNDRILVGDQANTKPLSG